METLKLAARPALLALIWIVASAHTISELSTVVPALRAAEPAPRLRAQRPLGATLQARSARHAIP